ncbi:MAG: hypothetical protein PVJ67_03035 [Candidatus Pacearchaeota archaeon]|jgi:hypothetical protein
MKLSKFIFGLFVFVFLIALVYPLTSSGIFLEKGKNIFLLNSSQNFYVADLVKLNPEIEAVSFYENNESKGYVNFLGGVGENFAIKDGVNYEIFMRENATIILPY